MVRTVTQLAQSRGQELDALVQFLPLKPHYSLSTDYLRVGSLEKICFSLINCVKIMWALTSKEGEENPLKCRRLEKPGHIPFEKLLNF